MAEDCTSAREFASDAFSSGSERGGKANAQHTQDNGTAKPFLSSKENYTNDAPQRERNADNSTIVSISDRKVKVGADSDSTSLYGLCRRWLRNDAPRKEQLGAQNFAKPLPKPLPFKNLGNDLHLDEGNESEDSHEDYLNGKIEVTTAEHKLLENHIKHFKSVRKRLRDQQKQRIERYKIRLALLLQPSPYQEKQDASLHY